MQLRFWLFESGIIFPSRRLSRETLLSPSAFLPVPPVRSSYEWPLNGNRRTVFGEDVKYAFCFWHRGLFQSDEHNGITRCGVLLGWRLRDSSTIIISMVCARSQLKFSILAERQEGSHLSIILFTSFDIPFVAVLLDTADSGGGIF